MSTKSNRHKMLKITVHFERRVDGGLRAWSDDVPGFVLSHSDPLLVLDDVEPALETILAARYECKVVVCPLSPPEEFSLEPELFVEPHMIPSQREYASSVC